MKRETSVSISIGGSFSSLLAIAFIVLKLCHVIEWSWLWVLSPIWITLGIGILLIIIGLIVFAIKLR